MARGGDVVGEVLGVVFEIGVAGKDGPGWEGAGFEVAVFDDGGGVGAAWGGCGLGGGLGGGFC